MRTRWMWLAAGWGLTVAAFASDAPRAKLTVRVLDCARLSPELLRKASSQAERVFREAGIEAEWIGCLTSDKQGTCGRPIGDTDLILRIVRQPAETGSRAFGSALLTNGPEKSIYASVFYRRVEDAARRAGCDAYRWLAYVMAHEAAHLLGVEHAPRGIMRPALDGNDLKRAAVGLLKFSDIQTRQLQDAVAFRLQGGSSGGLVLKPSPNGR